MLTDDSEDTESGEVSVLLSVDEEVVTVGPVVSLGPVIECS